VKIVPGLEGPGRSVAVSRPAAGRSWQPVADHDGAPAPSRSRHRTGGTRDHGSLPRPGQGQAVEQQVLGAGGNSFGHRVERHQYGNQPRSGKRSRPRSASSSETPTGAGQRENAGKLHRTVRKDGSTPPHGSTGPTTRAHAGAGPAVAPRDGAGPQHGPTLVTQCNGGKCDRIRSRI